MEIHIAIIGLGLRSTDVLRSMLKYRLGVKVSAVCDINRQKAEENLRKLGIEPDTVRFYTNADEMLDREYPDGAIVGTRCSLHAAMAIKVLKRNIPLFLEKPMAIDDESLDRLEKAASESGSKTLVSLPLRVTPLAKLAKQIIDSGELGEIGHVQALNNVAYGDVYYQSWYRDENETGGLFLQKAVHDFDYVNSIVGLKPVAVAAMKSKQVFRGNKPTGLTCDQCGEQESCPQGPFVKEFLRDQYNYGNGCCFATDTGNEDSGSALVLYENGMHLSYSQNFFCRNRAGYRGARFFGYHGTLEFNWVDNTLRVFQHDSDRIDTYQFQTEKAAHGGGDDALTLNFIRMLRGKEESAAPIHEAAIANRMCLKARQSAETMTFEKIDS